MSCFWIISSNLTIPICQSISRLFRITLPVCQHRLTIIWLSQPKQRYIARTLCALCLAEQLSWSVLSKTRELACQPKLRCQLVSQCVNDRCAHRQRWFWPCLKESARGPWERDVKRRSRPTPVLRPYFLLYVHVPLCTPLLVCHLTQTSCGRKASRHSRIPKFWPPSQGVITRASSRPPLFSGVWFPYLSAYTSIWCQKAFSAAKIIPSHLICGLAMPYS